MIYLIGDTHFNHEKIIEYCYRPFRNTHEMNETIIENWNRVVGVDDYVFHLGDFGFGDIEALNSKLNGHKILILGNHDRYGVAQLLKCGFAQVHKRPLTIGNYILSHKPIIGARKTNLHGHIHNADTSIIEGYDPNININLSADAINFTPVLYDLKGGKQ